MWLTRIESTVYSLNSSPYQIFDKILVFSAPDLGGLSRETTEILNQ